MLIRSVVAAMLAVVLILPVRTPAQVTVPCQALPCTFSVTVSSPAPLVPTPAPVPPPRPTPVPPVSAPPSLSALPLLQPSSLIYLGAFRVPADTGPAPAGAFGYGGTALAWGGRGSLFLVGHADAQRLVEIGVPTVRQGPLTALDRAMIVTPFSPPTGAIPLSAINPTDPNRKMVGGALVFGGRLVVSVFGYYDGAGSQTLSHVAVTASGAVGPVALAAPKAGYVSGYMAPVPAEWQAALGGPAVTGNCCLPIINRTSRGPALFAFDPAHIGTTSPVPATALVYYPQTNATIGDYGQQPPSMQFSGTTEVKGVVFPSGTRSVLFFGRTGTSYCYGQGTATAALDRQPNPAAGPSEVWCYDPENVQDKGTHGYPYRYQVWAYDALELAAVRAGTRQPWSVTPYAVWPWTFPYPAWRTQIGGAAFDPATGRVFVSQQFGEADRPVIHVYQVQP